MAFSPTTQEHKKSTALAAPQLLTPEEPLAHDFAHQTVPVQPTITVQTIEPTVRSPPASPEFRSFYTQAQFQGSDEVLYPDTQGTRSQSVEQPLFERNQRWNSAERQRSPSTASSLSVQTPPTQHSSPLPTDQATTKQAATERRSQPTDLVGPVALNNFYGLDYYRYILAQNEEHRARKMAQRTLPLPSTSRRVARDSYTEGVLSSFDRPSRVQKPTVATSGSSKPKAPRVTAPKAPARGGTTTPVLKSESSSRRHRRQTSTPDASFGDFPQVAQPKPRTRAAPSKKIDDKGDSEWRLIPDYCPPISSLDNISDKLVVQWTNSNELNLSDDPDREHLHPQELKVASVLRLKCNQYLANKRRIFEARYLALKGGKDFNKTSAQQSTKIDVNKASRLWAAFDNIGWFEDHWFQQHLQ